MLLLHYQCSLSHRTRGEAWHTDQEGASNQPVNRGELRKRRCLRRWCLLRVAPSGTRRTKELEMYENVSPRLRHLPVTNICMLPPADSRALAPRSNVLLSCNLSLPVLADLSTALVITLLLASDSLGCVSRR